MTSLPNPILGKKIIQRLKAGTTPLEGVRYVNVGHERYYQEIERLLDDLTTGDGADVHFLKADYGFGKTHFIGMVNALALDKNWVTSYVTNGTVGELPSALGAHLRLTLTGDCV